MCDSLKTCVDDDYTWECWDEKLKFNEKLTFNIY